MGEDLSAGIKVAVILILLASILASVFSIMSIAKNMTNSGVNQLQSSLHAFQNMRWEDYNLRTVTGNEVQVVIRSAIDNDIAVIVNTKRNQSASVLYGVKLNGFTKPDTAHSFYSYNSGGNNNATTRIDESVTSSKDDSPYFDTVNSCFVAKLPVTSSDGGNAETTIEYGSYTKNINDNTSLYYIDPILKFTSYIIKDSSGSLLGILFDEQ